MPRSFARPDRARQLQAFAAATLLAGYANLVVGDVTLAPVLLVIGYLVLVPLALLAC